MKKKLTPRLRTTQMAFYLFFLVFGCAACQRLGCAVANCFWRNGGKEVSKEVGRFVFRVIEGAAEQILADEVQKYITSIGSEVDNNIQIDIKNYFDFDCEVYVADDGGRWQRAEVQGTEFYQLVRANAKKGVGIQTNKIWRHSPAACPNLHG